MGKKIDFEGVLKRAAKEYEKSAVVHQAKAEAIQEVIQFLSDKDVSVSESVSEEESKPHKVRPTKKEQA